MPTMGPHNASTHQHTRLNTRDIMSTHFRHLTIALEEMKVTLPSKMILDYLINTFALEKRWKVI